MNINGRNTLACTKAIEDYEGFSAWFNPFLCAICVNRTLVEIRNPSARERTFANQRISAFYVHLAQPVVLAIGGMAIVI